MSESRKKPRHAEMSHERGRRLHAKRASQRTEGARAGAEVGVRWRRTTARRAAGEELEPRAREVGRRTRRALWRVRRVRVRAWWIVEGEGKARLKNEGTQRRTRSGPGIAATWRTAALGRPTAASSGPSWPPPTCPSRPARCVRERSESRASRTRNDDGEDEDERAS